MNRTVRLLPQPQQIQEKEGIFYTDYRTEIVIGTSNSEAPNALLYAKQLQESILEFCGVEAAIKRSKAAAGSICLNLGTIAGLAKEDGYLLEINENGVTVTGTTEAMLCHGVQTLRQLYQGNGCALPALEITDWADIPNRGFYHDATRGRVPKLAELKKLADTMCYYKMNQLQLYVEHTYAFCGFSEMWRDQTPLTAEEILELDEYCAVRHVELVPSMSTFGHLYHLLTTKSFGEYREMETAGEVFSFWQRMAHHTLAVSNPGCIQMIKGMMDEYMQLFRSPYFNLCADETFDLCKGKSKELLKNRDVNDVYTDYVKELCEYLLEKGKIPMFWGDIIWSHPEKLQELPKETICLNWGYGPNQREDETRSIASAGGVQYVCPGVGGWNEWINLFFNSYENIRRMCNYADKYHAIGVLNTDWGDFGHINQPEFSRPGMIYGAAFSWNKNIEPFEQINQKISFLEFGDTTGTIMSILTEIADRESFSWRDAVVFYDIPYAEDGKYEREEFFRQNTSTSGRAYAEELRGIRRKLQEGMNSMHTSHRALIQKYLISLDAIILWNEVKPVLGHQMYGMEDPEYTSGDGSKLAEALEEWFMFYKKEWRKVSKEGDLKHVGEVVFWYADQLRSTEK